MSLTREMPNKELIEKGIEALLKELGQSDTMRFISLRRERKEDSVERHRNWQKTLNKEEFFNDVFSDKD